MKKFFSVMMAIGFVLALLAVFPENGRAEDNDSKSKPLYNGITNFESWSEAKPTQGSAAGGVAEKIPCKELYNGVTFFDTCSGARVASKEDVKWDKPHNGVTNFE